MPDVLNRTTMRFIRSQRVSDYPIVDWVHFTDKATALATRATVEAIPEIYRKLAGEICVEMDAAEKTAKDAERVAVQRAAVKTTDRLKSPDGSVWEVGIDDAGNRTSRKV